ncbi:MAG TPA: M48 family metallopeptidase, partial [Saprospiraceae bacterium]|nr:M48 family metallopeptidase [Saprospiraceae bacterium]
MKKSEPTISHEFKAQASKAVGAIALFIFTYILLLLLAIALTVFCMFAGYMMIKASLSFLAIALGIGLASFGLMILIFLIKFVFKSNKIDRSDLIEISRTDEPALFEMIDELVHDIKTTFPKKVYLSSNVNASVFYDSSFWSMFLPVKKNLQIGVGLVNTVTKSELKAILAHEFGHFSQRSMKVGSYVYNVNQIIFNLVND